MSLHIDKIAHFDLQAVTTYQEDNFKENVNSNVEVFILNVAIANT
jgi:hypothetical protein